MELLEDALERARIRYLLVVAGYLVMPEHVHLLDGTAERREVPEWMQFRLAAPVPKGEGPGAPSTERDSHKTGATRPLKSSPGQYGEEQHAQWAVCKRLRNRASPVLCRR